MDGMMLKVLDLVLIMDVKSMLYLNRLKLDVQ
jgi:hypothetical protein